MIKETATVIAVDGDMVTVEAAIKSTCNSCQAQSDCGTGVISRALAPKMQQLTLHTPMTVKVGQQVVVGIPEAGILSASAWLYVLPLVAFIATYAFTTSVMNSVGWTHELLPLLPSTILTYLVYKFIGVKLQSAERTKYQVVLLNKVVP
ncbi:SoxR reducing system RseC family protein [Alteromonas sp. D210916BOD_24]|uniref:SoxR reducing system RseC family protein n=1 Tax=Alteromonas sp. D210916BOD_24 TaxID=3157618 RepID=UPI00399CAEDD